MISLLIGTCARLTPQVWGEPVPIGRNYSPQTWGAGGAHRLPFPPKLRVGGRAFTLEGRGGANRLSIFALALLLLIASVPTVGAQENKAAGTTLVGDTSLPDISTFARGESVGLTFTVNGLKTTEKPVTLELSIVDEHDQQIETKTIPVQADSNGRWQTQVSAPGQKLGFYRVYAKLSNGVPLQAAGSRPAGFLTYAVVPDPAQRRDYGETGSRFGMQGGFGPWADKVLALLGARWVLDGGLEWKKQEPDHAGQFGPQRISPKPIVPAYAAQSLLLDGCDSAGAIDWLGEKVWGYAFERPGQRILAVWNYSHTPREVSIPTGVKRVQVYDWMGNMRLVDTAAGSLRLKLGPEPVYIGGVSPKLWGRSAVKALTMRQKQFQVTPNGHASITGSALLPAERPFQGTLLLETDTSWRMPPLTQRVAMGTNRRAPFRFDLPVPAALPIGSYTARLLLRDKAGNTFAATGITFNVVAPLSVRVEPRFDAEGKPGVTVTLQDRQGQEMTGRLDLRLKELLPGALRSDLPMIDLVEDPAKTRDLPGGDKQVAFQVSAGGSKSLVIPLPDAVPDPTRRYQALIAVTAANGARFAQTASVVFLPSRALRHPVTIDGDLSDWASLPVVALRGPQDVIRSPQYYTPAFSAQWRFAWDAQALYLAAEVKDDVFFQNYTGGDIWRGDCLQLAFNLDPQIPDTAPNAGDRRTSELTVALTRNGPEAYRQLAFAPDRLALGPLSPEQIHLAIRREGDGNLIYEMAIPWTSLGAAGGTAWKAGDRIGLAATVNELRSADQSDPCALGLFGGIAADKDPDKFGTLVLGF